jgi:hypothetical protein
MTDWQKERSERSTRLNAGSRYASGKMVPPDKAKALLEAVIRPVERPRPARTQTERQVLDHVERWEDAPPLRHERDPAIADRIRGQAGDVLSAQRHTAPPRRGETDDRPGGGGLAGAISAEQGGDPVPCRT